MTDDITDEWRQRPCGCVEKKVRAPVVDFGVGVPFRWVLDRHCHEHMRKALRMLDEAIDSCDRSSAAYLGEKAARNLGAEPGWHIQDPD